MLGVLAARFINPSGTQAPGFADMSEEISADEALDYLAGNLGDDVFSLDSEDLLALVELEGGSMSMGSTDVDLEDELNQYLEENIDDLEEYLLTGEI